MSQEQCNELSSVFEAQSPERTIDKALKVIPSLALACSFGAEDMVLLDIVMKINPTTTVFYLDTDVLFRETYQLIDEAVNKYGIPNLIRVTPRLSLQEQQEQYGDRLWENNATLCCDLRKVRPLTEFLSSVDGWVTGIRRDQAPTRANAQVFERDAKFNVVKVNPLVRWTETDVWSYIRTHKVPYNPLHDNGYPSIGCAYCTLPVKPGADPRSGRWAGQLKTECGLHK
ncbi:phosphoadenylyl-sulfate reductase [Alicyclobacillus sp. SO9]|nr:phosphoadenylyl-sulfate reductase [Alicyclobacillus sp. SO9]